MANDDRANDKEMTLSPEELLARGREAIEHGAYEAGVDDCLVAASCGLPQHLEVEALTLSARALLDHGLTQEALDLLQRCIRTDARAASAWCLRGRAHMARDELDAAQRAFDLALELQPDLGEARYHRGALYALLGDPVAAAADLGAAIGDATWGREALFLRGLQHLRLEDRDHARTDLHGAARAGHQGAARQLHEHFELRTAAELLTWAHALIDDGEILDALDAFEVAIARGGHSSEDGFDAREARRALAGCYAHVGEVERALLVLDEGLAGAPDDGSLLLARGRVLAGAARGDEALAAVRRVLELQPDNVDAHVRAADLHARAGRADRAIEAAGEALARAPHSVAALLIRARAHEQAGDLDATFADLVSAGRLGSREADAERRERFGLATGDDYFIAAWEALQDADYERAIDHMDSGIGKFWSASQVPGDHASRQLAYLRRNRGYALAHLGRFEEAKAELGAAIESTPSFAGAHATLAGVLHSTGDLEGALTSHARVIELSPRDGGPRLARAALLYEVGRREAALTDLDAAVELLAPDDPRRLDAHRMRAEVYEALGAPQAALADWRAVARLGGEAEREIERLRDHADLDPDDDRPGREPRTAEPLDEVSTATEAPAPDRAGAVDRETAEQAYARADLSPTAAAEAASARSSITVPTGVELGEGDVWIGGVILRRVAERYAIADVVADGEVRRLGLPAGAGPLVDAAVSPEGLILVVDPLKLYAAERGLEARAVWEAHPSAPITSVCIAGGQVVVQTCEGTVLIGRDGPEGQAWSVVARLPGGAGKLLSYGHAWVLCEDAAGGFTTLRVEGGFLRLLATHDEAGVRLMHESGDRILAHRGGEWREMSADLEPS